MVEHWAIFLTSKISRIRHRCKTEGLPALLLPKMWRSSSYWLFCRLEKYVATKEQARNGNIISYTIALFQEHGDVQLIALKGKQHYSRSRGMTGYLLLLTERLVFKLVAAAGLYSSDFIAASWLLRLFGAAQRLLGEAYNFCWLAPPTHVQYHIHAACWVPQYRFRKTTVTHMVWQRTVETTVITDTHCTWLCRFRGGWGLRDRGRS